MAIDLLILMTGAMLLATDANQTRFQFIAIQIAGSTPWWGSIWVLCSWWSAAVVALAYRQSRPAFARRYCCRRAYKLTSRTRCGRSSL